MIFKKLELQGFKSFFDRTSVNFLSGVNAVVGPNGCGKSNIADAIRWVLGEQSPKKLRGENMEDLIFAGSDARGPLGMAEVTLTVESNGRDFPTPYDKFSEVAVTRRLYRSGESEFFINNAACRMRDIRELFMDTGMNPKAYAIIDQGHIGDIISSRPDSRRILFEEAAGIARYKERKAAALRKLDATDQNILRLNDVIREVKRQIRSLKLQATKAEKYNRLREEIEELEIKILYRKHCARSEENLSLQRKVRELEEIREMLNRETSASEANLETGRISLVDSEKEASAAREEYYSHRARTEAAEHKLAASRARCEQIGSSLARSGEEVTRLTVQLEQIALDRSRLDRELEILEGNLAGQESQHRAVEEERDRLTSEAASVKAGLDKANARFMEEVHAESETQNRVTQARTMRDSLTREIDRLQGEIGVIEEEEGALRAHEGILSTRLADERTKRETLKTALAESGGRLEQVRADLKSAEEDLHAAREEHAHSSSRLASLTELENNLSGWPERFRQQLDRILQSRRLSDHVRGLLASFVETPPEYETALEAVLGDRLKYLLVNSHETTMEAANALRQDSEVRGTLMPLDPRSPAESGPCDGPGVMGKLVEHIRVPGEYRQVIEHLLANVILVKDLAYAREIWSLNGVARTFVTPAGEVLWPDGAVTAGPLDPSRELLPLLRRIRETKEVVAASSEKVQVLSQRRHDLGEALAAEEEEQERLSESCYQLDMEISSTEKDLVHIRQKVTTREERRRQLAAALGLTESERSALEDTLSRELSVKSDMEGGRKRREEEITSLEEQLATLRRDEEDRKRITGSLRVELAAGRERLSHLRTSLERLAEDRVQAGKRLEDLEGSIGGLREELAREEAGVKDLELQAGELAGSREKLESRLADLQERQRMAAGQVKETEENLRRIRLKSEELHQDRAELKARQAELQVRLDDTRERIAEVRLCSPEQLWDEETREAVRQENGEEIEARHREMVARLQALGPVNLAAIGDHLELQERLEFQKKQQEDLEKASEDLRQAIRKINATSRKKFLETFEQINEKFQEVFPLLFTKGQATLRLTDADDPLDAGIEIFAQPAGKKLQRLSLLSGGEKALSAIALLLSIFMVKPTPFCLLDEVDAPLDDSNTNRFLELLNLSINGSQLVVITHNKQTMEQAVNLVGVTMSDPGISTLISVQLEEDRPEEVQPEQVHSEPAVLEPALES